MPEGERAVPEASGDSAAGTSAAEAVAEPPRSTARPERHRPWWRPRRFPGAVVLAVVTLGLVGWYLWFTYPSQVSGGSASFGYVVLEGEDVRLDSVHALVQLRDDDRASVLVIVRLACGAEGSPAVVRVQTPGLGADAFSDPLPPDRSTGGVPLADVRVHKQGTEGRYEGSCPARGRVELSAKVDYARTAVAELSTGRRAFGFQLACFDDATPESTGPTASTITVTVPEGWLLEDTYGETGRDLAQASWDGDDLFTDAFGTYSQPFAVARAGWLDNGLLLVLGAVAGILVERSLTFASRRRGGAATGRGTGATDPDAG